MSTLRTLVVTTRRAGSIATAIINRGPTGPEGPQGIPGEDGTGGGESFDLSTLPEIDAPLESTDTLAVWDNSASAQKKTLLSRIATWLQAQALIFSARPSCSVTSAPTNDNDLLRLADGDARYGQVFMKCLIADEAGAVGTNAYSQSAILSIYLPVGSWAMESLVYCSAGATFASSGSKSRLTFSGTQTNGGRIVRGGTNGPSVLAFPTIVETTSNLFIAWESGTTSTSVYRSGVIYVTVAGTLKVEFSAYAYNAASAPVLNAGSYLRVSKI